MKQIKKLILGIIIGISITSTVAYAAYIEAKEVSFTSSTGLKSSNVKDAIDEISNKCAKSSNNGSSNNTPSEPAKTYKCKRATTLHKLTSCYNDTSCTQQGDVTITFGNQTTTKGTLKTGDAFDCDVNGDGTYDSNTERFYYVTDLENDNRYAVLIYYNNVYNGAPSDNSSGKRGSYDLSLSPRTNGPVSLMNNLPTTSQWSNVSLSNTSRKITDELGNEYLTFSYAGKAVRLLTYDEMSSVCPAFFESYQSVRKCSWAYENTGIDDNSKSVWGYWLETVSSSQEQKAWTVFIYHANLEHQYTSDPQTFGVKPAIEVLKTDIDY